MQLNIKLTTIILTLLLSSCSTFNNQTSSIFSNEVDESSVAPKSNQEELIISETEETDSNEEETSSKTIEIENPSKFVKYYLTSKLSLYNSDNLSKIAKYNYKLALENPKNIELVEQAFLLSLASQNYADALTLIDANQSGSDLAFQDIMLYAKHMAQGDYKAAEKNLDNLLNTENRLPHLKILKAYFTYNKTKNIDQLKIDIAEINSSTALDGFKFYYTARAYEQKGDYEEAFKLYSNAFFVNTLRTADVFERLVYTGQKIDVNNKERLFESNSKYGDNIYLIDQYFVDLSKLKKIDNSLQAVSAQVFYDLGWSIVQTSSNLAGLDFLAIADYIKPIDKAKIQLAKGYYNNTWSVSAIDTLKSIKKDSPQYISANIILADILKTTDTNKAVDIINNLRTIKAINPYYLDAIVGQIYINDDKFELAAKYLTKALESDKSSKIYFSRAVAYERLGQYDKAIKDLNIALEKNPKNPIILNYLGYLLIDLNKDTKKGLELIEESVLLDPINPATLDSLGWANLKLNNNEKGLKYLEQAYALESNDGVITGHLGDAYLKNGRKEEAIIYWKKALELEKKDKKEITRIQNQLYKYNNNSLK